MSSVKRIRELTDKCVALADDRTLCHAEQNLRILTRQRAIRALLQAEKQAHLTPKDTGELTDGFDTWARVGATDEKEAGQTVQSKIRAGNDLIRRGFRK